MKQRQISGTRVLKFLKVLKSTVFDAIKRFQEFGDYSDRSRRGQKNLYTPKIDKKSVFQQQAPKSVMVWVAFSKTWKSPLIFNEKNIKINAKYYVSNVLKPISFLLIDHYKEKN